MNPNAASLKVRIRTLSRNKDMSAQVLLQNFIFERFLERLSLSNHKDHFILKGGLLIASMVNIKNRSTMDMDVTINNYFIDSESMLHIINEISNISVDDGVQFVASNIVPIRDSDLYGGYRVSLVSIYDTIKANIKIDITIGDKVTPKEVLYHYQTFFENRSFDIWAYNVETILAEKIETILSRGSLNTRPKDFYDVVILTRTQVYEHSVFLEALRSTMNHRETSHILLDIGTYLKEIREDVSLKSNWMKYTQEYPYAKDITYQEVINTITMLVKMD